jgi:hypothetical protein
MRKERERYARLSEMGCSLCRHLGRPGTPAEIHHLIAGRGSVGKRSSWRLTVPLCPEHHRGATGVHGLGQKAWERFWGVTERDLLKQTDALLVRRSGVG